MSDGKTVLGPHILPISLYLAVGTILLVLTAVTVYISFLDFSGFNLVVAMLIAAVKATLVALFFMHLRYDSKMYSVIFVGALMFLAVFIIFTMFDTLHRDSLYEIRSQSVNPKAVIYADSTSIDSVVPSADSMAATDSTSPANNDSH